MALNRPQRQFQVGQRVPLAVFFRNVSDRPLQVDVRPDFFWGNIPKVVNAKGVAVAIEKVSLLGRFPHYRNKLKPGEALGPLHLSVGLGENPRPGKQNWHPYCKTPVAGKYKLTHTLSIEVRVWEGRNESTSDEWKGDELTSGTIEFEIVDDGKPPAAAVDRRRSDVPGAPVQQEKPLKPKGGAKLEPGTEGKLQWGEPVNGLRAALSRLPSLGEPKAGEIMDFDLVVQNVSNAPIRLSATSAAPNPRKLKVRDDGELVAAFADEQPTMPISCSSPARSRSCACLPTAPARGHPSQRTRT